MPPCGQLPPGRGGARRGPARRAGRRPPALPGRARGGSETMPWYSRIRETRGKEKPDRKAARGWREPWAWGPGAAPWWRREDGARAAPPGIPRTPLPPGSPGPGRGRAWRVRLTLPAPPRSPRTPPARGPELRRRPPGGAGRARGGGDGFLPCSPAPARGRPPRGAHARATRGLPGALVGAPGGAPAPGSGNGPRSRAPGAD